MLALAAALSALVQLAAELFAPALIPQEDTVTILTPFVVLAGFGLLASSALLGIAMCRDYAIPQPWLPLAIPLVFLASMLLIIFLESVVGETGASVRLIELPVLILGLAWMWLGAMIRRPARFSSREDRDG